MTTTEQKGNLEEQKAKAVKTLATMFDYLGLEAQLKVSERGPKIAITISSEDTGRIIGRRGQILESFQIILNRMMYNNDNTFPRVVLDIDGYPRSRPAPAYDGPRDNGGYANRPGRYNSPRPGGRERDNRRPPSRPYRERTPQGGRDGGYGAPRDMNSREDMLRKQALDAAKEVKRWGDAVTLPKMNAHERRIVHLALDGDKEITTSSNGEGNLKSITISLAND